MGNRQAAFLFGTSFAISPILGLAPRARADDPPPPAPAAPDPLAGVEGAKEFPGDANARARLAHDGFVVLPRFHRQIFSPYIGAPLPAYVTTDSALLTYQVLLETALREIEAVRAKELVRFVGRLHDDLAAATPTVPSLVDAHALAVGYVAVARRLLGEKAAAPASVADRVAAEVALIEKAGGVADSPVFGVREDYARYLPRGIYAGAPEMEATFRAQTWLGRIGFRTTDPKETAAAFLVARAYANDAALRASHASLARFLRAHVGMPDDLTVVEYAEALDAGTRGDRSDAAIASRTEDLRARVASLRDPEVVAQPLSPADQAGFARATKGLRLLPSRLTPDAWLFQRLDDSTGATTRAPGLEIATALGSRAAAAHLSTAGAGAAASAITARLAGDEVRRRCGGTEYGATLLGAATLFDEASPLLGAGDSATGAKGTVAFPPPFFRSPAWHDRLLTTALSAWTGLRHAWVLHAKENVNYLGLAGHKPGVVEPASRLYASLAARARALRDAGSVLGAFDRDVAASVAEVLALLEKFDANPGWPSESDEAAYEKYAEAVNRFPRPEKSKWSRSPAIECLRAWQSKTRALTDTESSWVRSLAVSRTRGHLEEFATLMERLESMSAHELAGIEPTQVELETVAGYGVTIAHLAFFDGNSWLEPATQFGLVVDVMSDPRGNGYVEEAVGAAMEIYLVLPLRGGGRALHQGGVASYYEFTSPKPLTDDEWREQVEARRGPSLPAWTSSYVVAPDVDTLVARVAKGELPEELDSVRDDRIGRALAERIRDARPTNYREDSDLAETILKVAPYVHGPLREALLDALAACLLRAEGRFEGLWRGGGISGRGGRTNWPFQTAAAVLADSLGARERDRLLGWVSSPPEGATATAREWIAQTLARSAAPPSLDAVRPLLDSGQAAVRTGAVHLLLVPLEATRDSVDAAVAAVADRLDIEPDSAVSVAALEDLAPIAARISAAHAARFMDSLTSKDPSLRRAAAALSGKLGRVEDVLRLEELLADGDQRVASAAAASLSSIARSSKDAAVADRVVKALERAVTTPGGPAIPGLPEGARALLGWDLGVAAITGLSRIEGATSAAALARIAADHEHNGRLAGIALGHLGDVGPEAVPHLFRFLSDETPTSSTINGHQMRACDEAAEQLDSLLGGTYGWSDLAWGRDEAAFEKALDAMRVEARKRGYLK